jgi:hypothetical protein
MKAHGGCGLFLHQPQEAGRYRNVIDPNGDKRSFEYSSNSDCQHGALRVRRKIDRISAVVGGSLRSSSTTGN